MDGYDETTPMLGNVELDISQSTEPMKVDSDYLKSSSDSLSDSSSDSMQDILPSELQCSMPTDDTEDNIYQPIEEVVEPTAEEIAAEQKRQQQLEEESRRAAQPLPPVAPSVSSFMWPGEVLSQDAVDLVRVVDEDAYPVSCESMSPERVHQLLEKACEGAIAVDHRIPKYEMDQLINHMYKETGYVTPELNLIVRLLEGDNINDVDRDTVERILKRAASVQLARHKAQPDAPTPITIERKGSSNNLRQRKAVAQTIDAEEEKPTGVVEGYFEKAKKNCIIM